MKWNLAELLPGECIPGIVHDTVKVIDFSQRVHLSRLHLQKVILLSCERKKRNAQLKYEADSQCATLSMHVKGEDLLCLKYLSYTEAITPRNICRLRTSIHCTINSKSLFFSGFAISAYVVSLQTSYFHLVSYWALCRETCALTWLNIVPDNADMFVTVRPRVFVPESNHMTQLVHHNAKLVTVFPN